MPELSTRLRLGGFWPYWLDKEAVANQVELDGMMILTGGPNSEKFT
jgi:hypothetical protein